MQLSLQVKPEVFDPEDSTQNLKEIIAPKPLSCSMTVNPDRVYYNNIYSNLIAIHVSMHDATLP